jgi:hypothetical protein
MDSRGFADFSDLVVNPIGFYKLQFREVISAANSPFNPNAFTLVTTTDTIVAELFIRADAVVR